MYKLRLLFSIVQKLWREITSNIWRPAPPCRWGEGGQTESCCFVTTFFPAPGQAHLVEVFLLPTQLLPWTTLCQPVISFFPSVCRHPNAYFMFPKTLPFQNLMKDTFRPSLMFLDVSFGTDMKGLRALMQWFRNLSTYPSDENHPCITIYNLLKSNKKTNRNWRRKNL